MADRSAVEAALARARGLVQARDLDAAARAYAQILALDPECADAWFMQGVVRAERGELAAAKVSMDRAFALQPEQADVHRRAYARLRAELAESLWRTGRAASAAARIFDAIDAYRESLAIEPAHADRWNDLANACTHAGLLDEARDAYREALRLDPGYHQVESNLLILMHYDPRADADAIFAAHRAWAARHAAGLRPEAAPVRRTRGVDEPLRVGFLSPRLAEGPTGTFLAPLFDGLARARFQVYCYRVGGADDEWTRRLRRRAHVWHDLDAASDAQVADRIRADALDVLVDLAGHSPGGRPLALARKPAPVVATWLDYFDTTGLDAVDFLIGDPVSTPAGGAQRFSETVVRIAPSRLCYAPPGDAPAVEPPPALARGYVTFGSFNRLSKLAPPVIALWSRILAAVPRSRILLKGAAFADPRMRGRIIEAFSAHGIDAGRLALRSDSPHREMLAEYAGMDVALDPFPYNGGLTTCEALWMGAPVLALLGDSMIGRQSAALLGAAGLGAWVAEDEDAFVALAVRWSQDLAGLAALRTRMREQLRASALLDAAAFSRRFGESLLAMTAEGAGRPR